MRLHAASLSWWMYATGAVRAASQGEADRLAHDLGIDARSESGGDVVTRDSDGRILISPGPTPSEAAIKLTASDGS